LILNNNGLGPEGGRIIAEALIESAQVRLAAEHGKPLRKVLIGRNRLENGSSAAFAKMLEAHPTIQEFALPQCGIRSEGIVILSGGLAKCSNVKSVDLQDNTFTTVGAKAFAEAIPSWKTLINLNIGDCMCEDEGSVLVMKALCEAPLVVTLESLNFQYNEMKEDGAQILAGSLEKFTTLKTLVLNGNAFDPEGEAASVIKSKANSDILDDWSDMEYDEDEEDISEAGSGFITEKERQELIIEAEDDKESE
jgi:Ran GTPase-activating protein 1